MEQSNNNKDQESISNLITQKTSEYTAAVANHQPFGIAQHLRMEIKELDKQLRMQSSDASDE